MSDASRGDGRPGPDAVAAAEQALEAARQAVGAVVTVRARALLEAERLRARAEVDGLEALAEDAAVQERRAVALEPRIEQLRDLARRAELALEALRTDRGPDDGPAGPPDVPAGGA